MTEAILILTVLTLAAGVLTALRCRRGLDKIKEKERRERLNRQNIPKHPYCRCSITLMEPSHNGDSEKTTATESAVITARYIKPAKSRERTESAAFIILKAKQVKARNKWLHYSLYSKRLRIRLKYRKRLEAERNER